MPSPRLGALPTLGKPVATTTIELPPGIVRFPSRRALPPGAAANVIALSAEYRGLM
jgi:hypothetical protein